MTTVKEMSVTDRYPAAITIAQEFTAAFEKAPLAKEKFFAGKWSSAARELSSKGMFTEAGRLRLLTPYAFDEIPR